MDYIYFDIETAPKLTPELKAHVLGGVKAARNIKDPEKIKADIAKREASAIDDLGLKHWASQIIVLCYAINDGPVHIMDSRAYDNEADMLTEFFDGIYFKGDQWPRLVAFNAEFDVKGVCRRAMINNVDVPGFWPNNSISPWKLAERVIDPMHGGWGDYVKQKDLAFAFNIPVDDDIDGSDVAHCWATEPEKVLKHCASDVEVLRELSKRMKLI